MKRAMTKELIEIFVDYVSVLGDETGVYPNPLVAGPPSDGEDKNHMVAALDCGPIQAYTFMKEQLAEGRECIIGLDRAVGPKGEQGIDNDFLAIIQAGGNDGPRFGVMEYTFPGEPDEPVFKEIDWENEYWCKQLLLEYEKYVC